MRPRITFGKLQNVDMRVARVISAPLAEGTRFPCRVITLDVGALGRLISVGQFALLEEPELVGQNVIVVVNLGPREMGRYESQVLVLGAPHPDSPADQSQAAPVLVSRDVVVGSQVF